VIHAGDAEHSDRVERHAHREGYPAKARPNYQEASKMNRPEGRLLDQITGVKGVAVGIVHVLEISPGAR